MLALALATLSLAPLPRAHSHNDYFRPRPLLDALESGFASVEADIYLVDGDLLVAHDRPRVQKDRTLDVMYLRPLAERARRNGGSVHGDGQPLILLVDIKADGEAAYAKLREQLVPYQDVLTEYREPNGVRTRAITVILSGDRPVETVRKEPIRYVFLDGRFTDLEPNWTDAELFPLISDTWTKVTKWRGTGPMPLADRAKLRMFVGRAHRQRQKIRLWGAPDTPAVWQELWDAEVDLIGTDRPAALAEWMRGR